MSEAPVLDEEHAGSYTLADLEAMPDDCQRYELIDGALLVSAAPAPLHQRAAGRLRSLLDAAAPPDLEAVETIDVKCGPDTALEPDIVVLPSSAVEEYAGIVPAEHVAMVVEIMSPSSRRIDRLLKPQLYADAGIPVYLLVELKQPAVTWYRRSDVGGYTIAGSATGTEPLRLTEPFEVVIVPEDLVRRRTGPLDGRCTWLAYTIVDQHP
jgi:Uma2 family endonuclease